MMISNTTVGMASSTPVPAVTGADTNLRDRAQAAVVDEKGADTAQVLKDMMKAFAVQQFMETNLFGDPEETGMPQVSFDGDPDE